LGIGESRRRGVFNFLTGSEKILETARGVQPSHVEDWGERVPAPKKLTKM